MWLINHMHDHKIIKGCKTDTNISQLVDFWHFCATSTNKWRQIGITSLSSVCQSVTKLVWATPQKLLVQFHPNFTGMISSKSSCAYYWHFQIQWFELWPFNVLIFTVCSDYFSYIPSMLGLLLLYTINAISMKLYRIDW
jgi:hypothetical protein